MSSSEHKVRPRGPWLLVRLEERPEETDSGIALPGHANIENVQEKAGIVVAMGEGIGDEDAGLDAVNMFPFGIGEGRRIVPKGLEVGARVLFKGYIADAHHSRLYQMAFSDEDYEYAFIHMASIMGILDPDVRVGHLYGSEDAIQEAQGA